MTGKLGIRIKGVTPEVVKENNYPANKPEHLIFFLRELQTTLNCCIPLSTVRSSFGYRASE